MQLNLSSKVIGYFAYTLSNEVFCDGDACLIAGTEDQMRFYLDNMSTDKDKFIIKKTRFGEIMDGIKMEGAYAFDEVSYNRFLSHAIKLGITDLPSEDFFTEHSATGMHFLKLHSLKV